MRLLLSLIFVFASFNSFSQTFSGTILSNTREPVEAAYIYNHRSGNHAHSDESGNFLMRDVRTGDSVTITHVGFAAQTVVFANKVVQIVLKPAPLLLEDVTVAPSVRHLNIISAIDLQTNPVNSSQELLRKVPGLFIGQHAGGGKAEQIFLRGFDCDHGTDINVSVDGMPVNMVSHAHGQGYADLHFVIPETIEKTDFDKGPYYANRGNLATAGYVAFGTKDKLDNSSVSMEAGMFNTYRTTASFNIVNNDNEAAYFASEYLKSDGYFDSPQDFDRINLFGKYTSRLANGSKLSISASHFSSKWNASGQIPERLVKAGVISRFGSVDHTEGGNTSRSNVVLQFHKQIDANTFVRSSAFYSHYNFELYSNFTFFLKDSINGDQIKQAEGRNIFGIQSELNKRVYVGNITMNLQAAAGLRNDAVKNIELSHTKERLTFINPIKLGDVNETNLFGYLNANIDAGKWVINPGVRFDYLKFSYVDKLVPDYRDQTDGKAIVCPKLNVLYNYSKNMQFFIKAGKGFHSNDTRVVVAQSGRETLPAAYGADAGVVWKPRPRIVLNAALWYLYLQQEFVYVGDEGVVEPAGKTRRQGFDVGVRYQPLNAVFVNLDATYTKAQSIDDPKGEDYIPLAPKLTFTGGISVKNASGFSGSIKSRYMADRPANEDNSLIAKGYFVTDMNTNYTYKHFTFGLIAENIFNVAWKETQFATETRLQNEPQSVTEIHFTPGTPLSIKGVLTFAF